MMKKTTQTLLLIFSTLLLLVSVTVSAHAQTPDFTGDWNMVTDKGKTLLFTLVQGPRGVTGTYPVNGLTGSYQPSDGSIYGIVKVSASTAQPALQNLGLIRGTVKDNVLRFIWRQDNAQGTGRLTISSDGESLEGTFSAPSNPDDTSGGTLNGTRVYSFAGAWRGKLGDGGFELVLQQANAYQVTGRININSVIYDIREGRVDAKTLRFTIVRASRPLPNASVPDEVVGTAELVMERGGKSFTGKILGVTTSGTLVGR